MKNHFRLLSLLFVLVLSFSTVGCGDDDVEPTRTDILTAGEWTGFAVYSSGNDITQLLMLLPEPLDIRTWKLDLNSDGTFSLEGDRLDPSPYTGNWRLSDDEQSILFNENEPDSQTADIENISSNELFLNMNLEVDGTEYDAEIRFRR